MKCHLNVSVLGIKVYLIKTELLGYVFIQSAISGKVVRSAWLQPRLGGRGGIVWLMNAGSEKKKKKERGGTVKGRFFISCDVQSKIIKCISIERILANTAIWTAI